MDHKAVALATRLAGLLAEGDSASICAALNAAIEMEIVAVRAELLRAKSRIAALMDERDALQELVDRFVPADARAGNKCEHGNENCRHCAALEYADRVCDDRRGT